MTSLHTHTCQKKKSVRSIKKKTTARRTGEKEKKRPEDMGDLPGRMTMSRSEDRQSRVVLLKVRNGISSCFYSLPLCFLFLTTLLRSAGCSVDDDEGRKRQAEQVGRLAGFFSLFSYISGERMFEKRRRKRKKRWFPAFFLLFIIWFALN